MAMDIVIFLLLILAGKMNLNISNINIDQNFDIKANMIKNIKPYFRKEDQQILCKVEDVFNIFSKIVNIKNNAYDSAISSNFKEISTEEKKEKILTEMSKFMNGKNKDVAKNILTTKSNIKKVQNNLNQLSNKVQSNETKGEVNTMIDYMNSFKPVLGDEVITKIRKLEKIVEIIQAKDF